MAAIVPKGLASAVLASIPLQQGVPAGEFIRDTTYSVVLFTIIFTSLLVLLLHTRGASRLYQALVGPAERSDQNASTTSTATE